MCFSLLLPLTSYLTWLDLTLVRALLHNCTIITHVNPTSFKLHHISSWRQHINRTQVSLCQMFTSVSLTQCQPVRKSSVCADFGLPQLSLIFHTTLPGRLDEGAGGCTLCSQKQDIEIPDKVVVRLKVTQWHSATRRNYRPSDEQKPWRGIRVCSCQEVKSHHSLSPFHLLPDGLMHGTAAVSEVFICNCITTAPVHCYCYRSTKKTDTMADLYCCIDNEKSASLIFTR